MRKTIITTIMLSILFIMNLQAKENTKTWHIAACKTSECLNVIVKDLQKQKIDFYIEPNKNNFMVFKTKNKKSLKNLKCKYNIFLYEPKEKIQKKQIQNNIINNIYLSINNNREVIEKLIKNGKTTKLKESTKVVIDNRKKDNLRTIKIRKHKDITKQSTTNDILSLSIIHKDKRLIENKDYSFDFELKNGKIVFDLELY